MWDKVLTAEAERHRERVRESMKALKLEDLQVAGVEVEVVRVNPARLRRGYLIPGEPLFTRERVVL